MYLNNQSLVQTSLELIYSSSHAAQLRDKKRKISSGAIKDLQEENEDYIPHYKQRVQERGLLNGWEIPGVGTNYCILSCHP